MAKNLHIKNMVCNRCIEAVREEFTKAEIQVQSITLGEVVVTNDLSKTQYEDIDKALSSRGFEILQDQTSKIIDQIKSIVINEIHHSNSSTNVNFSTLISENVGQDYASLSKLFSSVEGVTIERYIIKQRIEKVKELIIYDELNLSQIALKLNYSSVAHLSAQFKKETRMSPSAFRKLEIRNRSSLDAI